MNARVKAGRGRARKRDLFAELSEGMTALAEENLRGQTTKHRRALIGFKNCLSGLTPKSRPLRVLVQSRLHQLCTGRLCGSLDGA
jgi:hypothetical protein